MPKSTTRPGVKEVVFQEFRPAGKYRVRLVRDAELKGPVILDVREYVSSGNFEGFTRRGIRLDLEGMQSLHEALGTAIAQLSRAKLV